jgi:hypothetical protein
MMRWSISVDVKVRTGLVNVLLIMIMMMVAGEKNEPHSQQKNRHLK